MKSYKIIAVASSNISEMGVFCVKDKKADGAIAKADFLIKPCNSDLRLQIAVDQSGKQLGFIEYTPSEKAWRPVAAENYLFIHCIALFVKEARHQGVGTALLHSCEQDARMNKKSGVCVMTSAGPWMADEALFERNGYTQVDALGRFQLMAKRFCDKGPIPKLVNWQKQLSKYKGWNLVYANQCPWHKKSIEALQRVAERHDVDLKVLELGTHKDAQKAPSGFGVYSLIRDGRLLEDHYLSATRFENILKKELQASLCQNPDLD